MKINEVITELETGPHTGGHARVQGANGLDLKLGYGELKFLMGISKEGMTASEAGSVNFRENLTGKYLSAGVVSQSGDRYFLSHAFQDGTYDNVSKYDPKDFM